mmetsp:Transcript_14199/g.25414  ORF Transcript_14199/g.25414 Transcript_14199/m.25414 type:complete len:288 (+) Transcript_14199:390-1253(+)
MDTGGNEAVGPASRPIPIRGARGERSVLSSPNLAQSAPPRAPVIGSLPAASVLQGNVMPFFELPPQSMPYGQNATQLAQSAPAEHVMRGPGTVLHALKVSERGPNRNRSGSSEGMIVGSLGRAIRPRGRRSRHPHRVSFDSSVPTNVFNEEGEDEEDDDEEGQDEFDGGVEQSEEYQLGEGGGEDGLLESTCKPSSVVMQTVLSLSLSEKPPLEERMRALTTSDDTEDTFMPSLPKPSNSQLGGVTQTVQPRVSERGNDGEREIEDDMDDTVANDDDDIDQFDMDGA